MTFEQLQTAVEALEALSKTGNDYAEVETQARLLLAEAGIENEPELHCKVLLALSTSLYWRGYSQEALPFAEKALSLAQGNQLKDLEARALGTLGKVHSDLTDYALALEYLGKALELDEELGNKAGMATHLSNIGIVHLEHSDYALALEYYGKALELDEELGNKAGVAACFGNIGNVYANLSDYARALEYLGKALLLKEELGNKAGVAIQFGNIGVVHGQLSDYVRALEYFGKALALHEELGNKALVASWLGNIGTVHYSLSNYASALEYYGKALALHEELGDKVGVANWLGNIGTVHYSLSNYASALEYYGKALALAEELGNKALVADNLGNIGTVYGKEGFEGHDTVKAEECLLKALAINGEIGAKQNLYENHKGLAELYEKTDRKSEAFDHLKKYHELKDEVQSEEAKKKAAQLDYERKIAEQEKQIAIERAETQARLDEQQKLLHNVLPPIIAERLLNKETFIADSYPNVSVLFMDLVNFTRIAAIIPPRHLIYVLNTIFSNADAVMEKYGLEKIKTIGDAYMAVAGAPVHQDDHVHRAALAAIDVMEAMNNLSVIIPEELGETSWTAHVGEIQVRIGLHCGEAIGGVIGEQKFAYDLWGDAVNTAARMESHGEAGKIHCSEEFKNALAETQGLASQLNNVQFIPRGEMEIKGKGTMRTYFLEKMSEP